MYTAEQIRNRVYVPTQENERIYLEEISMLIALNDYRGINSVKINMERLGSTVNQNSMKIAIERAGYSMREVEFLGTKYLEISW